MEERLTELARVIVCHRGRVLAIEHRGRQRRLGLPGGHLEPGESPAQAAARELAEETGLRATAMAPLGLVGEPGRLTYLFVAEATGTLRSSPEGRVRWARPDELKQLDYGAFHKAALRWLV